MSFTASYIAPETIARVLEARPTLATSPLITSIIVDSQASTASPIVAPIEAVATLPLDDSLGLHLDLVRAPAFRGILTWYWPEGSA